MTESMAKIVASGGDFSKIRFTFQEYFRRMTSDPERWSQPFAALLGAYDAQIGFGLPSIGGKDSMSGTFNDLMYLPHWYLLQWTWQNMAILLLRN